MIEMQSQNIIYHICDLPYYTHTIDIQKIIIHDKFNQQSCNNKGLFEIKFPKLIL